MCSVAVIFLHKALLTIMHCCVLEAHLLWIDYIHVCLLAFFFFTAFGDLSWYFFAHYCWHLLSRRILPAGMCMIQTQQECTSAATYGYSISINVSIIFSINRLAVWFIKGWKLLIPKPQNDVLFCFVHELQFYVFLKWVVDNLNEIVLGQTIF